jgi:hypothetical protein
MAKKPNVADPRRPRVNLNIADLFPPKSNQHPFLHGGTGLV